MNTTIKLTTTTFSTRLMAAAAAISISLAGALMPGVALAAPAVNTARVDICSSARPAGVWFPPQVEMQFKAQCISGSGGVLATPAQVNPQAKCSADHAQLGWVPPQVEMQFAEWCK